MVDDVSVKVRVRIRVKLMVRVTVRVKGYLHGRSLSIHSMNWVRVKG